MTKDEYIRLRLTLAQDFASKCNISSFVDFTPFNQRPPGWKPYGKMDWAVAEADNLLRAAGITEPE